VAALEEESFRRTADSVQSQLLLAMTHNATNSNSTRLDPTTFGTLQTFVDSIRNQKGLGRISVTADPSLLARRKDLDIRLESGDVIYIPQRPSTVSVLGAVLQPGTFPYHAGMLAADYLKKAGGPSDFADDSLTYIVMPDGSAQKLDRGWLPFGSTPIPAGSVIVVPRDIAPVLWTDILQNSTQVFSQLAIAGASLAVISGR
jgi:polysaccharide biosynthesis/export protein